MAMAFISIQYVILTVYLFSFCRCQDVKDPKVQLLEDAIGKIEALSLKIEDLKVEIYTTQDFQNSLTRKLEDFQYSLSRKLEDNLQKCSTKEQLSNLQQQLVTPEVKCVPPSYVIQGLGCVTPVREKMNWQAAKQNCRRKGSRLLEGITSQEQLYQLKVHFNQYFLPYGSDYEWEGHVWVGVYQWKWASGVAISPSSLWRKDEPDRGNHECGFVDLTEANPPLGDFECYKQWYSLCQIPNI